MIAAGMASKLELAEIWLRERTLQQHVLLHTALKASQLLVIKGILKT